MRLNIIGGLKMAAYEVTNKLFNLFDEKQNEEVSMIRDVFPAIKEEFLFEKMTAESLCQMNEIMTRVMEAYYRSGISFCTTPVFAFDASNGAVVVEDIVYKRL